MQLILDTVPVLREEDRQDLLQVTVLQTGPSRLNHKLVVSLQKSTAALEMFHCHSFPGDAFIHQAWVESEEALL